MASPTRWTWVWVNSGSLWWTGKPGVLWFTGSQRVGHDWATELNWTDGSVILLKVVPCPLPSCFTEIPSGEIWPIWKDKDCLGEHYLFPGCEPFFSLLLSSFGDSWNVPIPCLLLKQVFTELPRQVQTNSCQSLSPSPATPAAAVCRVGSMAINIGVKLQTLRFLADCPSALCFWLGGFEAPCTPPLSIPRFSEGCGSLWFTVCLAYALGLVIPRHSGVEERFLYIVKARLG